MFLGTEQRGRVNVRNEKEIKKESVLDTEQRGRVNVRNEKGIKKESQFWTRNREDVLMLGMRKK